MDFIKEANCTVCHAVIKLRRNDSKKHLKKITQHSADGETETIIDQWYCDECWNAK